jgi:hypothetical protein
MDIAFVWIKFGMHKIFFRATVPVAEEPGSFEIPGF